MQTRPGTTVYVTCTGYTTTPTAQLTGATPPPRRYAESQRRCRIDQQLALCRRTGTIGGYIKIEEQNTAGIWTDVTMEILNYGIGGPNLDGTICADPTPNAILRIQRLSDNGGARDHTGGCNYAAQRAARMRHDYWPNVLFDTREGLLRDVDPAIDPLLYVGGVMYYVALDVANLTKWFTATAPN